MARAITAAAAFLAIAGAATASPACQCDPTQAGFCNLQDTPSATFDCRATEDSRKCAKGIFDALFNDKEPSCGCLATTCSTQPQRLAGPGAADCREKALQKCWFRDDVGCSDDDDNNDMCVYFCVEYFVNDNNLPGCVAQTPRDWSPCELQCQERFAGNASGPFGGLNAPEYADCIVQCKPTSPPQNAANALAVRLVQPHRQPQPTRTAYDHPHVMPVHRKPQRATRLAALARSSGGDKVPVNSSFADQGEYFVDVSIGSPAQVFRVQIDTGSSDLGVPKWGCTTCGSHADRRYTPSDSKTSSPVLCREPGNFTCAPCHDGACAYEISYEDDSGYRAERVRDEAAFGTGEGRLVASGVVVGAIYMDHRSNPMQPFDIDGIIGFGYQSISNSGAPTLYEVLVSQGRIDDIFALCLDAETGGYLALGSDAVEMEHGSIQWTPLLEETYYVVDMQDMLVGSESIRIDPAVYNRGGAIVDSGSTDIILPRTAFDAFRSTLLRHCSGSADDLVGVCRDAEGHKLSPGAGFFRGDCFAMNAEQIAAYPPLTFKLADGVELSVDPKTYIRQGAVFCDDATSYGFGVSSGAVADGTVLGDVAMEPYLVIFDRASKRVGFRPADRCADVPPVAR